MVDTENIAAGLGLLFTAEPFAWLVVGLVAGFLVGVLPGFEATNAAALFLPFSVALTTESALLLMVGIYAGANFAGAVPGILMNVPGTASAAATALDGYPLATQGKATLAIGLARMASVVGGVLSGLVILLIVGPMSTLALSFGTPEMFLVAFLGLLVIGTVMGDSLRKGILSALMGLIIAAMAVNPLTSQPRFTFGYIELYEGVPFIPVIIGLFAITQMFITAAESRFATTSTKTERAGDGVGRHWLKTQLREATNGVRLTLSYPVTLIRSSAIGMVVGMMPGMGTAVANFVAYGDAKTRSKHPETFGKGEPEGIVAAESCENAVVSGTLVPTLTLGIPGSGTAAVMLAALYLHGVQPGPRVMQTHAPEAYAVLIGVLVASVLILPIGVLLATPMALVVRLKPATLVPPILMICLIGTYAFRNSLFDVWLAVIFGLIGVLMRATGYPVVPLILGLILGPIIEANFLRSLLLSRGSMGVFFESNVTRGLWAIIIIVGATTMLSRFRQRRTARGD